MIVQVKTQTKHMSSSFLAQVPLKRQTRYFWKKETIMFFKNGRKGANIICICEELLKHKKSDVI